MDVEFPINLSHGHCEEARSMDSRFRGNDGEKATTASKCETPRTTEFEDTKMEYWLPVIWFGVIGFGVLMYVLLDGFVLGLGILAPFAEDEGQLDHMMNTAAPIWDGNETWLVLGGAGLLAAFPRAYAIVLSALYLPVLVMLIALVFRGVAFEFRFKAKRAKRFWGGAFAVGSMVTAFSQGVILGALVRRREFLVAGAGPAAGAAQRLRAVARGDERGP